MKLFFIFTIILNTSLVFGQTTKVKNKYNFEKNCHSEARGQQDCNYCLSKAVDDYSKIMIQKYNCIIGYFNVQINLYSKSNPSVAAEYKRNKNNLISSQATWYKLKKQNASYYEAEGGTITPMLVADSMIKDFKSRLDWLDNLIEEEGQGNESKLPRCE